MAIMSADTSPETERVWLQMMRETPAWRKMELMDQLNAMAREFALAGLHARHPGADARELQRRLADLLLGAELAERVYGPLVVDEESRP